MREATASGTTRNRGQEVDVILPYLDLLKMRMEERLTTDVAVPAGLRSAEFPSMVLQVLVENAIRHGLEPKTEGGSLTVNAEIVDARLVVRVTDSGVGLGQAPPTQAREPASPTSAKGSSCSTAATPRSRSRPHLREAPSPRS